MPTLEGLGELSVPAAAPFDDGEAAVPFARPAAVVAYGVELRSAAKTAATAAAEGLTPAGDIAVPAAEPVGEGEAASAGEVLSAARAAAMRAAEGLEEDGEAVVAGAPPVPEDPGDAPAIALNVSESCQSTSANSITFSPCGYSLPTVSM